MLGWLRYLVYIMSLFIPPVGVVTFWIFTVKGGDLADTGKWAFFFAFIGVAIYFTICIIMAASGRMAWWGPGMGMW